MKFFVWFTCREEGRLPIGPAFSFFAKETSESLVVSDGQFVTSPNAKLLSLLEGMEGTVLVAMDDRWLAFRHLLSDPSV
jgi:hypothetical protein